MRRVLIWTASGLVVAVLAVGITVRAVPSDAGRWHVDPMTAPDTGKPNDWRIAPPEADVAVDAAAPTYDTDARDLAAALDGFAMRQPRVTRLAGGPSEGWATYMQRSRVFGFPDYVSVRFIDLDGGQSTLAAFSRSRYGHSDMGTNRARLEAWIGSLEPFAS